jgi:hypothetical protein
VEIEFTEILHFKWLKIFSNLNRATQNNTKDYKSVPQGHKKTPIS